jgi:site-specific DNA-cytosine methylase
VGQAEPARGRVLPAPHRHHGRRPPAPRRLHRRVLNPDGSEQPRLTASEAGRLQGFPADYPWTGADVWQQIGNAAPVQLGTAILAAGLGIDLRERLADRDRAA